MLKHTISSFLKSKGFQMEVDELKVYQIVHVSFVNTAGEYDETSFDISCIGTKAGNQELADLYKDFCKENQIKTNTVLNISVVASADTEEELKLINI